MSRDEIDKLLEAAFGRSTGDDENGQIKADIEYYLSIAGMVAMGLCAAGLVIAQLANNLSE